MPALTTFRIRPYTTTDRPACSRICVLTGNAGKDATGQLSSDEIWGEIFALPYVDRHPEYAFVVEASFSGVGDEGGNGNGDEVEGRDGDEKEVVGYIVATPETQPFEEWFASSYWPSRAERFSQAPSTPPPPSAANANTIPNPDDHHTSTSTSHEQTAKERDLLTYASSRGHTSLPTYAQQYPAHMHINLLPPAQGKGLGRQMIDTLKAALKRDGVKGLHLGASAENDGACAFYKATGFGEVQQGQKGVRVFAIDL